MKQLRLLLLLLLLIATNLIYANDEVDFSIKCHTFSNSPTVIERKKREAVAFQADKETMQKFAVSLKKRFCVHYDTSGIDAVSLIDLDKNGIPDYIDSACAALDYAYDVQVTTMKLQPPRTDFYHENDSLYDVYVKELGLSDPTYGFTATLEPKKYGDGIFKKRYTRMVIDNNYSAEDTYTDNNGKTRRSYYTTGIDALKVTTAHEFHHAIQLGYGEDDKSYAISVLEMGAVCMEIIVHPEIKDYIIYVNAMLSNLNKYKFHSGDAINGYCYGIFFYMLTEKYGKNIVKEYWDIVEKGVCYYQALEQLLVANNTNLAQEWSCFMQYLYHSGKNAIDNQYFADAKNFTTPVPRYVYSEPYLCAVDLLPYELAYIRYINTTNNNFIMPDTVDIWFSNANTKEVLSGAMNQKYSTIQCSALTAKEKINDGIEIFNNYWLKIFSLSDLMLHKTFTKNGGAVTAVNSAYPQPYEKSKDDFLYFPIDDKIVIGEKVNLEIYDANMKLVQRCSLVSSIYNNKRAIQYMPSELDFGIYTFTVGKNGIDIIGKFVIK